MTGRGPTGPERRGGRSGRGGKPTGPAGRDRDEAGGGSGSSAPEGLERLRREALSGQRKPASVVARGTLRRVEVETRPLVLDADDGTTWELLLPPGWVVDAEPGARVTVSGDPATDPAPRSTVGRVLRVRSLSRGD